MPVEISEDYDKNNKSKKNILNYIYQVFVY